MHVVRVVRLAALCFVLHACSGGETRTPAFDDPLVPSATNPSAPTDATPAIPSTPPPTSAIDCTETPPGAHLDPVSGGLCVRVDSAHATELCVELFAQAQNQAALHSKTMQKSADRFFVGFTRSELASAGLGAQIFYGVRAFGPNWPRHPSWTPGSTLGFLADVDVDGNRFNPNKLLSDPYARELSHDPTTPTQAQYEVFFSGAERRAIDSAPFAPKGVVLRALPSPRPLKPARAFADEVIYEAHVRGLTMNDPSVDPSCRGTYAGAAQKAAYLRSLGVTAIEFLPLHETQNDTNDVTPQDTAGDNYWGYMSLSYFAPDRRYACDKSPGGPSRELAAMIDAFHSEGIKVYVDVVFNHTGEGGAFGEQGSIAPLLSWRGIDNASYYELGYDASYYFDNNGVGPNFNATTTLAVDHLVASLRYWSEDLGVDGFRFDLASVLGNACSRGCFLFDPFAEDNLLRRAERELPARPTAGGAGVDLIAEPWAIGAGTYQVGNFRGAWAEWNDHFRETIRRAQNRLGVANVSPGELARRVLGSDDLFKDDGRRAFHSVNFIVAHDGLTLADLYRCNGKYNTQAWPYGPSDGGTDNDVSWDQGNDAAMQRRAARTGMALLGLSHGVPMFVGGDERLRSLQCNNNAYNLDSPANWQSFEPQPERDAFERTTRAILALRAQEPVLRARQWLTGVDADGNGLLDVELLNEANTRATSEMLNDAAHPFLAWRFDAESSGSGSRSLFIAYNWGDGARSVTLPAPAPGLAWQLLVDTAQEEPMAPMSLASDYQLAARSVFVVAERAASSGAP